MIDREEFAKICDARDVLCKFCELDDCEKCIVQQLVDDAFAEFDESEENADKCDDLSTADNAFAILQLDAHSSELFLSIKELQQQGKTPDLSHYNFVYTGPLTQKNDRSPTEILESLYMEFNVSIPGDFRGHSLSVSDIVILKTQGDISAHYVDCFGFTELEIPKELKIKEE